MVKSNLAVALTDLTKLLRFYKLINMSHTTLAFSSIVLKGHHDSVNAVKFNADLSMLLSGGKLFVCLPSVA